MSETGEISDAGLGQEDVQTTLNWVDAPPLIIGENVPVSRLKKHVTKLSSVLWSHFIGLPALGMSLSIKCDGVELLLKKPSIRLQFSLWTGALYWVQLPHICSIVRSSELDFPSDIFNFQLFLKYHHVNWPLNRWYCFNLHCFLAWCLMMKDAKK